MISGALGCVGRVAGRQWDMAGHCWETREHLDRMAGLLCRAVGEGFGPRRCLNHTAAPACHTPFRVCHIPAPACHARLPLCHTPVAVCHARFLGSGQREGDGGVRSHCSRAGLEATPGAWRPCGSRDALPAGGFAASRARNAAPQSRGEAGLSNDRRAASCSPGCEARRGLDRVARSSINQPPVNKMTKERVAVA